MKNEAKTKKQTKTDKKVEAKISAPTETNIQRRFKRITDTQPSTHLFTVGQTVHLKRGILPSTAGVYTITANLPPIGDMPQYRIRCESEKFDRMATQTEIEPVEAPADRQAELIEKSFAPADAS